MSNGDTMYRLAGALCIMGCSHDGGGDWPCDKHVAEARRQLSVPASVRPPAPSRDRQRP